MTARPEAIALALFDLDGTLLDSAPDIADALDEALLDYGHDAIGETAVRSLVGHGAARLVHRALTGAADGVATPAQFEPVLARFLERYGANLYRRTRPYGGVPETLARLAEAGFVLGCITNKPERFARPLLEAAGLDRRFALVLGGDSLAHRKPDPAPVLHACRTLRVPTERTAMIGDSRADLDAARGAGVIAVSVRWGYSAGADLNDADASIEAMEELPDTLERLLGGRDRRSGP